MALKTIAVVCSSRTEHLQISLACAWSQTVPFAKIVVVAWGANATGVSSLAIGLENVQVVFGPESGTTSVQRNVGLKHARTLKPNNIVFFDDDTFLQETWHEHVQRSNESVGANFTIGSIVTFASNPMRIQSSGHLFSEYRPLDLAYGVNVNEGIERRLQTVSVRAETFSCPCANCALIPWAALERIVKIDGNYFDEKFPRLICFELGFKMHRLGYGYVVAPGAFAAHDGYLHRQNLQTSDVKDQLLSRILLYKKFLPVSQRELAFADLDARVLRWASNKYPHSRIAGQDLMHAYNLAQAESQSHEFGASWIKKIK